MRVINQQFDPSIAVKDLSEHPENPRQGDDEAVAESVDANGFYGAILVQKSTNRVVAGNTRLRVAQKEGAETIPGIWLDVSDEEARRILLADNRTSDLAYYDDEALFKILAATLEGDGTLLGTGYDDDTYQLLLHNNTVDLPAVDAPDDAPAITQAGDIWLLGEHRLMCGDSTNAEQVKSLMNERIASMVFTDPPYGLNYQSNMRMKTEKFDVLLNDDTLLNFASAIQNHSEGWVFVWTSWKVIDKWLANLSVFDYPSNMIIWDKGGGGIGDLEKTFSTDYEIALVWHRGANIRGKRIGSIWSIGKDNASSYLHPTQKPVELAKFAITATTEKNELVLDLFAGSGSTLIAAHLTNRICYTMELDQHYCDIICARYQKQTGNLPQLQSTGEVHDFLP